MQLNTHTYKSLQIVKKWLSTNDSLETCRSDWKGTHEVIPKRINFGTCEKLMWLKKRTSTIGTSGWKESNNGSQNETSTKGTDKALKIETKRERERDREKGH